MPAVAAGLGAAPHFNKKKIFLETPSIKAYNAIYDNKKIIYNQSEGTHNGSQTIIA